MTQLQYERLLSKLARALSTQRRYVVLVRSVPLDNGDMAHSVNLRGYRYRVTLRGDEVVEVARETREIKAV